MSNSDDPRPGHIIPPTHLFTHDIERIDHIISDEQLMQLANGGRDISLHIAVGALGVAIGCFQNFVAVAGAVQTETPVPPWEGGGAAIFLIAATTFVVASLYYRRTRSDVDSLVERIRGRRVAPMAEQPYVGGEPFPGDPDIATDTSSTTD